MKFFSNLSIIIGTLLIFLQIFFKFNGTTGYIITISSILLITSALLLNKKLREPFIRFILEVISILI